MQRLIETLHKGGYSCVIRTKGEVRTYVRRGVADLFNIYKCEPRLLEGADIADKVVGKGAAAIMVAGGVGRVYADVVSDAAADMLREAGIDLRYLNKVPFIENRSRTGHCPVEERCGRVASAADCLPLIEDFLLSAAKCVLSIALAAASLLPQQARCSVKSDSLRVSLPIDEVVVTGTRCAVEPRLLSSSLSVVGRRTLDEGFRTSVLPTLVERVPGLFVTSRGVMGYGVATGAAGGMTLRGVGGSPTSGLLVLIDGHPQYMGLMGHPIADACRTMMAERVEVVRGPASVLYGSNAMGGVINIVTRRMHRDGVETDIRAGYGSFNTLQTQVSNRIKAGRFTSTVAASYDRTDGHRRNMSFEQAGGYVKAGVDIGSAWSLAADADITHFNASNPGPVTKPITDNDSHITRGRASIALHNDYARTSGGVTLFYNWGRHRIYDGYAVGAPPPDYRFESHDDMAGVSWWQNASLFRGNRLTVGFDYRRYGGRAWNRFDDGRPDANIARKTQNELAGYVMLNQRFAPWLAASAGVRFDCLLHRGAKWIPQGGLSFMLPCDAQIKVAASRGFRFPTIREMYMFPPQNPDLKAESLMNYELSFEHRTAGGRLSYGVAAYFIDGSDMIVLRPVDGRPRYVNTGRIRNFGVECDLVWAVARGVSLNVNYSWLHMKYPVVAAPRHKAFCGIDFAVGRWRASTGVQYVGGLYTSLDPVQSESFVLWNVDAAYGITRWLEVFVRGENLLAQRYEINAGYPMPRATVLGGIAVRLGGEKTKKRVTKDGQSS